MNKMRMMPLSHPETESIPYLSSSLFRTRLNNVHCTNESGMRVLSPDGQVCFKITEISIYTYVNVAKTQLYEE